MRRGPPVARIRREQMHFFNWPPPAMYIHIVSFNMGTKIQTTTQNASEGKRLVISVFAPLTRP